MRATIGGNQDRRNFRTETAADAFDRCDAVATIEMIIDQQSGHAATARFQIGDRQRCSFGIGNRDDLRVP